MTPERIAERREQMQEMAGELREVTALLKRIAKRQRKAKGFMRRRKPRRRRAFGEARQELQEFLSIFKRKRKRKPMSRLERLRKEQMIRLQRGACPPGYERSQRSGDCVKECPQHTLRNPDTGRCVIPTPRAWGPMGEMSDA